MDKSLGWSSIELHGNCAQYAIKHSLLLLGITLTIEDVHKASGLTVKETMRYGTDEKPIKKAIRYFGLTPLEYELSDSEETINKLNYLLEINCPVVACVAEFQHWIVIAGKAKKGKYIYIDSAEKKLIATVSEDDLVDWLSYDNTDGTYSYYIIGITARDKKIMSNSIVEIFSRVSEILNKDKFLKLFWGYYLKELLSIAQSPKDGKHLVKLETVIADHEKDILNAICSYLSNSSIKQCRCHLDNLKLISKMHKLTVPKIQELQAIIKLTCLLFLLVSHS